MIIGGLLVKNEANKWLKEYLAIMTKLCDTLIVLDDASTDNTVEICQSYNTKYELDKVVIFESSESLWETNEVKQRIKLFNLCKNECMSVYDWVIILDADELIEGDIVAIKDWIARLSLEWRGLGFTLYDMWSNTHYRDDFYWNAHYRQWPMAFRAVKLKGEWNNSPLHCGRFPMFDSVKCLSTNIPIKHMGWSTPELRQKKYNRYMRIDGDGKHGILGQYHSILDENPVLKEFRWF